MKNVKVLIGNYGSGKSELALNFAMQAAARGERTELIDLDMVNTYFRLTERGKMVEQKEIRLVSPNFACSGIETLSLPAEVQSAFVLDWDSVIFDVGGDDVGSTALGRYHEDFMALAPGELEVLNVVNIRRPLAGTVEKIIHLQEEMELHSRLKITGMINNTNLAQMTGPAELRDGYEMIKQVSEITGVPVAYTSGGNYWGFDVELAQAVCDKLGWGLQIQPIEKENVYIELYSGNIDCAWGGIALDEAELEAGRYTQYGPYMENDIVVASREGSSVWNSLRLSGRNMAMPTTEEAMAALNTNEKLANRLGQITRLAGGITECFEYLYAGKCDAVLTDTAALYYYNSH